MIQYLSTGKKVQGFIYLISFVQNLNIWIDSPKQTVQTPNQTAPLLKV